ncbi:MAG: penicillin-binding protein 2 [Actinobacteria bacterium]|nr:penicillin-binding protein 2 [Actinomycetota bacterium]
MRRANKRLALFMGLAVLFLIALLGRAFYVQVVAASALKSQANVQSTRTITLAAPRGAIYDRDGVLLATSQPTATVYVNPRQVKDPAAVAKQLTPILGRSEQDLITRLTKDSGFEYLARKIELAKGEEVKELEIAGVGVCTEDKRLYPAGAVSPQLLGYVGTDNTGLAGVEYQYEERLSGEPGKLTVVSDLHGNRLDTALSVDPVPGQSLTLTIDESIQFEVEKVLTGVASEFNAKRASAIVLDPTTGDILAMGNTPIFDTNRYGSTPEKDRRNSAVVDMYEPGSTFKMVAVAAALQEGLVTPSTKFQLGRTIKKYDRVVHEAHEGVPEVRELTVEQILAQSSNVGAVTIGLEVGKDRLVDMIRKFGFTQKLGIDFPGEAPGLMPVPDKWSGTTILNIPIGQGISVTPLQMAAAYGAIANNGVLIQPHLAKDINTPWSRRVVSDTVAAQLRSMLMVTVEDGTGTAAQVPGYTVAGKTGTAQKVNETGGYAEDRFVASFVGMVPASSPRLVILVMVDEPTTEHLGAKVAAPAFACIADYALKTLGIPPESID